MGFLGGKRQKKNNGADKGNGISRFALEAAARFRLFDPAYFGT
jgi:hypothetical protein